MSLAPGTRLGPYEISGAIGAGGMGSATWPSEETSPYLRGEALSTGPRLKGLEMFGK